MNTYNSFYRLVTVPTFQTDAAEIAPNPPVGSQTVVTRFTLHIGPGPANSWVPPTGTCTEADSTGCLPTLLDTVRVRVNVLFTWGLYTGEPSANWADLFLGFAAADFECKNTIRGPIRTEESNDQCYWNLSILGEGSPRLTVAAEWHYEQAIDWSSQGPP